MKLEDNVDNPNGILGMLIGYLTPSRNLFGLGLSVLQGLGCRISYFRQGQRDDASKPKNLFDLNTTSRKIRKSSIDFPF